MYIYTKLVIYKCAYLLFVTDTLGKAINDVFVVAFFEDTILYKIFFTSINIFNGHSLLR